jgi:hypothetical protein
MPLKRRNDVAAEAIDGFAFYLVRGDLHDLVFWLDQKPRRGILPPIPNRPHRRNTPTWIEGKWRGDSFV